MSVLYKLGAFGLLVAIIVAGFFQYRDSQRAFGAQVERTQWADKLLVQKREAQTLLGKEQEALEVSKGKLAAVIKSLGEQRATLQAENDANLRKYAAGYRLQYRTKDGDGGGRGGGVVTQTSKAGTAIDASATFVQLPSAINENLFRLAGDAQSLLIDYRILYAYVNNPKLICTIREGLP